MAEGQGPTYACGMSETEVRSRDLGIPFEGTPGPSNAMGGLPRCNGPMQVTLPRQAQVTNG